MRTSKRISKRTSGVALAGTLLLTMGLVPCALGSTPLRDLAESYATQEATESAAASEGSSAEEVASGDGSSGTIVIGDATEAAFGLKTCYSPLGVRFQVGAEMTASVLQDTPEEGVVSFLSETGFVTVDILADGASLAPLFDELAADPTAFLNGSMGLDGISDGAVSSVMFYEVDGAMAETCSFTYRFQGDEYEGRYTMLRGDAAGATVLAAWRADATEADVWMFEQVGRSLALTTDGDVLPTEPAEPATASASATATLELPSWKLVVSTDPSSFVYTTVESWDDAANGKAVIGVPVTFTNVSDESSSVWWGLTMCFYGPSGLTQTRGGTSPAGYFFDDSPEMLDELEAGETVSGHLYFYDGGDGEYAAEFNAWDENWNNVLQEVVLQVAR